MKDYSFRVNKQKLNLIQKFTWLNLLLFLLYFFGCASLGFITYYDPTTYKNLTDLKPEVISLYETFAGDLVNTERIAAIRLKLAQMYEYEKGKGGKNKETYEQIRIIQNMFERHVNDRLNSGTWSKINLDNLKKNIMDAFDIAIKTERLKNKNE